MTTVSGWMPPGSSAFTVKSHTRRQTFAIVR
jgi:hypothetical protein